MTTCRTCARTVDRVGPTGLCRLCADRAEALCRAHARVIDHLAADTTPRYRALTTALLATTDPAEKVRLTNSYLAETVRQRSAEAA